MAELKDQLSLLGRKTEYKQDYAPEVLEAFDNKHPENDYWVRFNCPEFTSLCPITGQPDFAEIRISYIPDIKMVESKSLKLYLFSFRSHGAFHEDCVNIIMKDLIKLMNPKYIEVTGIFTPRGGISIYPYANYGRPGTKFDVYSLSQSNMLSTLREREMLKKGIVFYQTIGVEGTARKEIDLSGIMDIEPSRIRSQLMPLLPSGKKFFPIDIAKRSTMQYLTSILTLSPREREYMESFSKGIYKPELLFSDPEIIRRITDHPMALWKISRITADPGLSSRHRQIKRRGRKL